MEIVVSLFAVIVALGCVVAIYLSSRKDNKQHEVE